MLTEMSMEPNKERDQTVYEDLFHISELWQKSDVTNPEIRQISVSLRRLLVDRDLQKIAAVRRLRLVIKAPDNKPLLKAADRHELYFFQSGGVPAMGVWLRALTLSSSNKTPPLPDFHPDRMIDLTLDGFLKQPVFFLEGKRATRGDVIKYVANKAGGVHFDEDRRGTYELLDAIRSAVTMKAEGNAAEIRIDLSKLKAPPPDEFLVHKNAIDAVFVEVLATCRFLSESDTVRVLRQRLEADLGL